MWIAGDEPLLRRALENVTRNALRYAPPGSRIEIELKIDSIERNGFSITTVRDTGIGVPDAKLEAIFEPFTRVDTAREREIPREFSREFPSGGTGLGLAIAWRAVAAQGGSIRARNCAEGGLEIEITLIPSEA